MLDVWFCAVFIGVKNQAVIGEPRDDRGQVNLIQPESPSRLHGRILRASPRAGPPFFYRKIEEFLASVFAVRQLFSILPHPMLQRLVERYESAKVVSIAALLGFGSDSVM
jgi:hypothetical protein